jgi:hypothetical protein
MMEVSEDKRLREMGIDPNGDSIDIMMEVRRQAEQYRREEEEAEAKAALPPSATPEEG